jgi:hypothetical protein
MLSFAFLTYYYPASKMLKVTSMLTNFKNHLGESSYDGLDRFKGFLISYPHHGFPPSLTIIVFMQDLVKEIEMNSTLL